MRDDDNFSNNPTKSPRFSEVAKRALSRRDFIRTSSAVVAGSSLARFWGGSIGAQTEESLIGFTSLTPQDAAGDWMTVAKEYQAEILIPWGTALDGSDRPWEWPPTGSAQAQQVGVGHDGMWFFPLREKAEEMEEEEVVAESAPSDDEPEMMEDEEEIVRGVLCLNHEFGRNESVFGKSTPESLDEVRASQHAHGVSVLDFEKVDSKWKFTGGCHTRRIHVNTPVEFSGPAADSIFIVRADGSPLTGTLNNCGSGRTPWGTYLTCEENFQGYFGSTEGAGLSITRGRQRYGFSSNGFGYGWHLHDHRFELSGDFAEFEELRYGWVVEIDPFDVSKPPVKHTALGRFKHESCEVVVGADNRIVAYMGDDQTDEYIYKFIGNEDYKEVLARGESPFEFGDLYVARFDDDFTGRWIRVSNRNRTIARNLGSMDRVMIYTRLAADILNPTPMDRPEWISAAPNGDVYCALTNNYGRDRANAANPQAPNEFGHIIRWHDDEDPTSLTFTWDIFVLGTSSFRTEGAFGSPDTVWVDPDGRLFICTDGAQPFGLKNQVVVADTNTGELKRLFVGVPGSEVTGATVSPDRKTLFVNIQHPGNGNLDLSDFPRLEEDPSVPRDATVAISRIDGGIVGS